MVETVHLGHPITRVENKVHRSRGERFKSRHWIQTTLTVRGVLPCPSRLPEGFAKWAPTAEELLAKDTDAVQYGYCTLTL